MLLVAISFHTQIFWHDLSLKSVFLHVASTFHTCPDRRRDINIRKAAHFPFCFGWHHRSTVLSFFIFNCAARFCANGSSRDAIISSSTSIIERSLPLCSTGRNISSCISTFFCFAESSLPPRMSPIHVSLLFGTISVPSSPDSSARYPTDFMHTVRQYILCRSGDIFLLTRFLPSYAAIVFAVFTIPISARCPSVP